MFSQLFICLTFSFLTLFYPVTVLGGEEAHDHNHHHHHEETMDSMDSSHSMGHHSMGMDMNGSDMDMAMMKPYFHSDLGDTLLFKEWILKSSSSTLVACIAFFLLGVLYEGLKSYREFLITQVASKRCYSVSVINVGNGGGGCPEACGPPPTGCGPNPQPTPRGIVSCKMWSWAHFYQSLLHILQVVASYTLMLGFMSFNIWICLAIALGAGHGYFLFCWKRITIVDMTDHCN